LFHEKALSFLSKVKRQKITKFDTCCFYSKYISYCLLK
jgi:hypothetical protein